ncbi:hypothetical protein Tco_0752138 [Tanacetum coccineum]|uniref:Reverse transcriptase domain-containing protein n=1 Tax=Tanacetum coccineum TaxID=301880 RepID=A0ABQ4Z8S3_9ASTR
MAPKAPKRITRSNPAATAAPAATDTTTTPATVTVVGGLPDMIHGNVVASRPKTMQEAIGMANELIDKKINTIAERQADNKRKYDDTSKNNQHQSSKRQDVARAYTAGSSEKKPYGD